MLEFVKQKMLNKKWIMLCLVLGNIFLVAVASCSPMYTDAIQQKVLKTAMSNYIIENNEYPGEIRVKADISVSGRNTASARFFEAKEKVEEIKKEMDIDLKQEVVHYYISKKTCKTQSVYNGSVANKTLTVGMLEDFKNHVKMVSGDLYADKPAADGTIDAVISQKGLVGQKLLIGEVLIFDDLKDPDGNPLKVRISGVFENSREEDLYWVNSPNTFSSEIIISEQVFEKYFGDFENTEYKTTGVWHLLYDYEQMKGSNTEAILAKAQSYENFFGSNMSYSVYMPFKDILERQMEDANKVEATLFVLQIPILVLLAAFIFMVSRQILEMEQNDISIIKSRGASRKQILQTYLIQSGFVAVAGIVLGILLGMFLCQVFGSANAFLEFVQRRALSIRISWEVLLYAVMAVLIGVIAMLVPAVQFSKLTIVETKQKRMRKSTKVWWQRYFIDILLLGVSLYGLYSFSGQKKELAAKVAAGGALDPLLYFSSSLFIIGTGLVLLRVIPLINSLLFKAGKKKWKPEVYTAFLQVIRTKAKQYFIMLFLMLTVALGIFNAKSARTINTNAQKRISYSDGADIVLMEQWDGMEEEEEREVVEKKVTKEGEVENEEEYQASIQTKEISADDYTEPDYAKYSKIKGVESTAKVYITHDAEISVEGNDITGAQKITLMGIHTKDFGETAWFSDELLDQHWYHYLNAISQNTNAVLVSSNFKSALGYKLGDVVTYTTVTGQHVRGIIYGFVDYWPGYNPKEVEISADGSETEKDRFLIVAHLKKLQNVEGILPYEVWLKMAGSTQAVYDFIEAKNVKLDHFTDTKSDLIDMKNDPIIQGTNGTLTVGFIVVLLLCSAGFLIYWILSIRSRALQFGIYRAMGMTMQEIFRMLVIEQVFITGPAVVAGTLIGLAASKLYIPLIQIAYSTSEEIIPLTVAPAAFDMVKMYVVVIVVIGICMGVLGWLISKIKIAQALKLGED